MGYIENVKNTYFDKISEVKTNQCEAHVSEKANFPKPEPMSHEKKGFFSLSQNQCSF
jgi:hypothetical protein